MSEAHGGVKSLRPRRTNTQDPCKSIGILASSTYSNIKVR